MTVQRFDNVKLDSGTVKKTDEGYLEAYAPIARLGVYKYRMADGSIRNELVDEETLFNKDSLVTLSLKPVTNTHPAELFVNANNIKSRRVGTTGETAGKVDSKLMFSFVVDDIEAISDIYAGRKQLSPGYTCELVQQSGEYNGERYDSIQRNRKYNHLALCDNARGGSSLALNVDGVQIDEIENNNNNNFKGGNMSLTEIKLDGISYQASPEVVNQLNKIDSQNKELQIKLDSIQKDLSTVSGERDVLKAKVDSLEKVDLTAKINAAAKERVALLQKSEPILKGDEIKIDELSNLDIKKAVVNKRLPQIKLDGKDEVYIQACFDTLFVESFDPSAMAKQRQDSQSKVKPTLEQIKNDSEAKIMNKWQETLGGK